MYSRSFYPDSQEKVTLPNGYYGTAFSQGADATDEQENLCHPPICPPLSDDVKANDDTTCGSALGPSRIPIFSSLFGKDGFLGGLGLCAPQIGTEEILIIATAAFIFFSKGGDKETALILLLLLFIN